MHRVEEVIIRLFAVIMAAGIVGGVMSALHATGAQAALVVFCIVGIMTAVRGVDSNGQ